MSADRELPEWLVVFVGLTLVALVLTTVFWVLGKSGDERRLYYELQHEAGCDVVCHRTCTRFVMMAMESEPCDCEWVSSAGVACPTEQMP